MFNTDSKTATFEDRFGETRKLRKTRHGWQLARNESTIPIHLARVVAKIIGRKVKAKRIERGLTLEKLATQAGLRTGTPKTRMWEIENNVRAYGVRLGTLYALAIALSVDVCELLPTTEEVYKKAKLKKERDPVLSLRQNLIAEKADVLFGGKG